MSEFAQDYDQKTRLLEEITRLEAQLADVMHAGDMEHARMAAIIEACEAFAEFALMYSPENPPPLILAFLANLRVYGKNARAAVQAVRPQADALLERLKQAEFKAVVLEAQIGGWEAACALQVAVLQDVQSYLYGALYNVETLKRRIEEATETNAGQTLLRELAILRELAVDVQRWRDSGDGRDLAYVLETMDKIEAGKGTHE